MSTLIRTFRHARTEVWAATEYDGSESGERCRGRGRIYIHEVTHHSIARLWRELVFRGPPIGAAPGRARAGRCPRLAGNP